MAINNPLTDDSLDVIEENTKNRIGEKIRRIREQKGMTQAELGAKVDLNGDRIQKYECGTRNPKAEMTSELADALGVDPMALVGPSLPTNLSVMYALFEMEEQYSLTINRENENIVIDFESPILKEYVNKWCDERIRVEALLATAKTEEERKKILLEYKSWEWTFPRPLVDETQKHLKRAKLEDQIKSLQEQLKNLED